MERHKPIKGLALAQNTHIEEVFGALRDEGVERVVELGTQNGGFTIFLSERFKHVFTFDNKAFRATLVAFKDHPNITFTERDIFSKPEMIAQLIKRPGRTLLLCDNGNKIREVDTFAPYLKQGDIIMAHDYARSREYFKKNIQGKYWNHLEITDADINRVKHNLAPYLIPITEKSAWFCAIKL